MVKAAEGWRWPLTSSSTEVTERVWIYVYYPFGPLWPILRWIFYMVKYIYLYKGVHLKSKLQHSGTWSAAAWQYYHLCYRPATFFRHFRLLVLPLRQGKIWNFHFLFSFYSLRLSVQTRNLKLLKSGSVNILRWEQIRFSKRYVLKKFRPKDEVQRNGHIFVSNKGLTNSGMCVRLPSLFVCPTDSLSLARYILSSLLKFRTFPLPPSS